ncbi:unnamed protein product [Lupinus luteus]|uniref:Uncharacterized protein n=1 Tax=Lupinus luteus TaxID=3873 RepID=A0AAV1Y7Z5_LUPLU
MNTLTVSLITPQSRHATFQTHESIDHATHKLKYSMKYFIPPKGSLPRLEPRNSRTNSHHSHESLSLSYSNMRARVLQLRPMQLLLEIT